MLSRHLYPMVLVHKSYLDYVLIQEILVGGEESNIEGGMALQFTSYGTLLKELSFSTFPLCKMGNNNLWGCLTTFSAWQNKWEILLLTLITFVTICALI